MLHTSYNCNIFINIDNISYYLLGLYITDGNIYLNKKYNNSISVELKSIDLELLEKIKDLVCPTRKITLSHNKCYRLRFHNQIIGEWLINNECIPNKTKVVKFPNIPAQFLPDFVRGLIDGDGSIGIYGKHKAMIRFDSASLQLITGLQNCLLKWNLKCSISETPWIKTIIDGRKTQSTTQMYRIALTGLKAYKLLKILYKNDPLSMLRKKKIAIKIISLMEGSNFSEQDLLSMDRIPSSNMKWNSDEDLMQTILFHNGNLKNASKELNVSAWALSCKLRKIGQYDYIRQLFPIQNIKNITNTYTPKLKVSDDALQKIYLLMDQKVSYKEIALQFCIDINYVAFLKRKLNKNKLLK